VNLGFAYREGLGTEKNIEPSGQMVSGRGRTRRSARAEIIWGCSMKRAMACRAIWRRHSIGI
jgi:hypothetical protein